MHCNLNLIIGEYEIHYDCFLCKELLEIDDWLSMEQRNQRQVRYPSGKVRNQVAVDINFWSSNPYERLHYFGGKESIPGQREINQVTHTQIYCTSITWICRELQYIEEIYNIN